MSFESEIEEGFAELESEAGVDVRLNGTGDAFRVVISNPTPAQLKVDLALGRPYLVRVEARRSVLPTPRPKVGDAFVTANGVKYAITDSQHQDVSDPTIPYVCRTSGQP